jgi:acetyl esterase
MPVDPQVQVLLDQMAAMDAPGLGQMGVEETRAMMEQFSTMGGPGPDVASVENRSVPGPAGTAGEIPVRIYRPTDEPSLPVLVWIHGGGFVIGSLDGSDVTCRELANKAGVIVVSVDYRLAPEAPFPEPVDDCVVATSWVVENAASLGGDPARVAVGGDSAGGNLSAVVALLAAQRGRPSLRFQLLVYPAVDLLMTYPSIKENGSGYLLTKESMDWFMGHYFSGAEKDPKHLQASPIYADEIDLGKLPPALIITAEYDPLRDEGEAYGKRLEQAGVPVTVTRYAGQIHGFFGMTAMLDGAKTAVDQAADALKAALQ